MKTSRRLVLGTVLAIFFIGTAVSHAAENRDAKVRNDKNHVEASGQWIYNEFDRALEEGQRTGKPILVTLRCIP